MLKQVILLLSVDVFERKDAEFFEGRFYHTDPENWLLRSEVEKFVMKIEEFNWHEHVKVFDDLSVFQAECNDQEIELENWWMTYIQSPAPASTPTTFTELTKQQAEEKCELVYLEAPSGFHLAVDNTYIDQVGHFTLTLPTGEVLDTQTLDEE